MAKRKPLRQKGKPRTTTTTVTSRLEHSSGWQASVLIHPQPMLTTKRRVFQAHQKHSQPPTPVQPTLADRFRSLPSELRAHIFSFLLVQPVKWSIPHRPNCDRTVFDSSIVPWTCDVHCSTENHLSIWRSLMRDGLVSRISPWRSQWAAEQMNPYVCTTCYDERLRPGPFPKPKALPCLCARRSGLQVLLVCKQWYNEAAVVFYTQNTFAFEDSSTLVEFAQNLRPEFKIMISKISLMAWDEQRVCFPSGDMDPIPWSFTRPSRNYWSMLRQFPYLAHLELNALFLTDVKTVYSMLRLGLQNVKCLCFVMRGASPNEVMTLRGGSTHIWPQLVERNIVAGSFAGEVARQIKGQRQWRLKRNGVVEEEVAKFKAQYFPAS